VAERAGFVREGRLRQAERLGGSFAVHYIYGILREEYLSRATA
jgi:ribosomal-protein-serine acetyltransferase